MDATYIGAGGDIFSSTGNLLLGGAGTGLINFSLDLTTATVLMGGARYGIIRGPFACFSLAIAFSPSSLTFSAAYFVACSRRVLVILACVASLFAISSRCCFFLDSTANACLCDSSAFLLASLKFAIAILSVSVAPMTSVLVTIRPPSFNSILSTMLLSFLRSLSVEVQYSSTNFWSSKNVLYAIFFVFSRDFWREAMLLSLVFEAELNVPLYSETATASSDARVF